MLFDPDDGILLSPFAFFPQPHQVSTTSSKSPVLSANKPFWFFANYRPRATGGLGHDAYHGSVVSSGFLEDGTKLLMAVDR